MILADTKVGDQLILYGSTRDRRVVTVTRTTKCFVHTDQGGGRFNRRGGTPSTDPCSWRVNLSTPELIACIRAEEKRRNLLYLLTNLDWAELTDLELRGVFVSLPECVKSTLVEVK